MSVYVNQPMFDKHAEDSILTGMAFWAGFMHGVSGSATANDEKIKKALHKVYTDVFNTHGELNNTARVNIKSSLEQEGVGITEEGVEHLWKGYVDSLEKK